MRKHRHANCLPGNPDYLPEIELFKKIMVWWHAPSNPMPLGLVGETGTGKTDLLLYIADRLNEPVYVEKITTGLRAEMLEGCYEMITDTSGNPVTRKRYGQATIGYKEGGLVIFDEIDKANEDVGTSLHLYLEGKPWTLSSFGETVSRHPLTRISCTANTVGEGGHERYITSRQLDGALRNRVGWLQMHYLDRFSEEKIVHKKYPNLPAPLVTDMIKVGNGIRDALLGPDRDGNIDDPIATPFSTRNLVNWAYYVMAFGKHRPIRESFDFVFGNNVNSEDKDTIEAIIQRVFANDMFDKPVEDYLAHNVKK